MLAHITATAILNIHKYTLRLTLLFSMLTSYITCGSQADVWEGVCSKGKAIFKLFPTNEIGRRNWEKENKVLRKMKGKSNIVQKLVDGNDMQLCLKKYDCDLFCYYFEEGNKISEKECKHIFHDICNGVFNLHKAGIAHLDLKPENVLVDKKRNKFYLCDFGFSFLCKKTSQRQRKEIIEKIGNVGTKEYLAPEIRYSPYYNPFAADIYSLGCLFFCLLTGCFPQFDRFGILVQNCGRELPTQFEPLVKSMLAMDPYERPTIEELLRSNIFNERSVLSKVVRKASYSK